MDAEEVAKRLRLVASRVRRLMPLQHYPERFHEEKSEIAHDLAELAEAVCPSPVRAVARQVHEGPRLVVGTRIVDGRHIRVELRHRRRQAFAISV